MAIKNKAGSRNLGIVATFMTYHFAKFWLWRYGYFATFFYKTRLMTFIPLTLGLWYSTMKKYPKDLNGAGLQDYVYKKAKFERDVEVVSRLLQNRANYIIE